MAYTQPVTVMSPLINYDSNSSVQPTQEKEKTTWKTVEYKKRPRNSPDQTNQSKRQTTINDYWLKTSNPIPTKNLYAQLNDKDDDAVESPEATSKPIKAPPIFVSGVENITPLKELLNIMAPNQYLLKILSNNQVKIQLTQSEKYLPIMDELKKRKTQCYTYQRKQEKNFKVFLRGMHQTTDTEELSSAIEGQGHKVVKITNILQSNTKKALPLFHVELEQNDSNKDIYKIKKLLNTMINFEQPHKKRDIPQCIKCQAFGHTKNYCYRSPKCVKCAGSHHTNECTWQKKNNDNVKCANCQGNHPASYKGCIVRKQLQQKLYPKLREKVIDNFIQPTVTYSQVVERNVQQKQANTNEQVQQTITTPIQESIKLEDMVRQLMSRMDTMLNILTALITKLK